MRTQMFWVPLTLVMALAGQVLADVGLVTVPRREGTQLTIYNSEDITVVREHRLLDRWRLFRLASSAGKGHKQVFDGFMGAQTSLTKPLPTGACWQ